MRQYKITFSQESVFRKIGFSTQSFRLCHPFAAATLRSCDFYNPQAMSLCTDVIIGLCLTGLINPNTKKRGMNEHPP